ncbi:unnamed protein product [Gongylonema pulchrum]|uniref:Uncharacterized protein n=1 Tax=Gongylonema pulchrum TaxID=637853 RepID=A0A183ESB0_9BILA|nr:unnamed protein product [Gongylonema pulchrum]
MKSQVEKLLSSSANNENGNTKTLRPHPERLKVEEEADSDTDDEEMEKETKAKKYVPPKVMAVYYNGLSSELVYDPVEKKNATIQHYLSANRNDDSIVRRRKQKDLEKQKYEEDYLIRLQVSKKERHKKRLENRQNILDELLHFGNYMAVQNAEDEGGRRAGKKRTKLGRKGKLSKKPRLAMKNKKEKNSVITRNTRSTAVPHSAGTCLMTSEHFADIFTVAI